MADKVVAPKMVREGDLLAVKKAKEKVDQENQQLKSTVARLQKRLEVVDLSDVEDADLKNIKEMFLARETELDERESKVKDKEGELENLASSYKERERNDMLQSLASKYAPKGEDENAKKANQTFQDAIKDAEDPEKEALRLYAERLSSEKKEPSAEEIFETAPAGGKIKKSPLDIDTSTPEGKKEMANWRNAHIKV